MVKTEEELLAFGFEDLVNGLGGALGLFLGWSLLQIFNQFYQYLHCLYIIIVHRKANKSDADDI